MLQGNYPVFCFFLFLVPFSEAATGDVLKEKVFLEISQNHRKTIKKRL